jgi:hypothetical protein
MRFKIKHPEYTYLQYIVACAMKWYDIYIICIEINKYRMIIFKNKGKDTRCKSAWETNLHEIQKYMRYKSTWDTKVDEK